MNKKEIINKIEEQGKYCKVRIDVSGDITGMLSGQDYRYNVHTNTGGRRYIGNILDRDLTQLFG